MIEDLALSGRGRAMSELHLYGNEKSSDGKDEITKKPDEEVEVKEGNTLGFTCFLSVQRTFAISHNVKNESTRNLFYYLCLFIMYLQWR